uniref:Plexin cytoplasmic RasGAP domain-containing protein n=1 Tax=Oryzias melastigma TaxID=30732 RepID=A0A3B3E176_ORYME
MRTLLLELMDEHVQSKNPKLMLRRSETVVERMLCNWMSICLYQFLRDSAGEPLYKLFKALKHQVEKGPVDAKLKKAKYTLNDTGLLGDDVEYSVLTLQVFVHGEGPDVTPVKVLNCDTITQVSSKERDMDRRRRTTSDVPVSVHRVAPWIHRSDPVRPGPHVAERGSLDQDQHAGPLQCDTRSPAPRLGCLTVRSERSRSASLCRKRAAGGRQHLPLSAADGGNRRGEVEERQHEGQGHDQSHHGDLPDPSAVRQGAAAAPLRLSVVPPAVKYFFDFLDEQALRHDNVDEETLHIWKTNSLPLRFWVNILRNPWWTPRCTSSHRPSWTPAPRRSTNSAGSVSTHSEPGPEPESELQIRPADTKLVIQESLLSSFSDYPSSALF